jgi:hypothetical protein
LLRGIAGLPGLMLFPGKAEERFQPIALGDLAEGIARLLEMQRGWRTVLYAAGPEPKSLRDILRAYRAWLGFPPAREISMPAWLLRPVLAFGDLAGWLGYATPLRSTSFAQLRYDTRTDGSAFAAASGVAPKGLAQTFAANPATLQDRLHARTFFLVPLLQVCLALFWIFSGVATLLPSSFAEATTFALRVGLSQGIAAGFVAAAAMVDILLGVLFLLPRWVRWAGAAQLAVSAFYLVGLSWVAPELWTDHFGPLLKVLPLMAATAVVMAFHEKR